MRHPVWKNEANVATGLCFLRLGGILELLLQLFELFEEEFGRAALAIFVAGERGEGAGALGAGLDDGC